MSHPFDIWTWERCSSNIRSLIDRNGFPEDPVLKFLGFELDTKTGGLLDTFTGKIVDTSERSGRSVSNTICYVLSAYGKAENIEPTEKLISSKQFRGARFTQRDIIGEKASILREFGGVPESLITSAKSLGGSQVDFPYGDVAIRLNALPQIPVTIVITVSDGDLPPDVRIFYDSTIEQYFDSEETYFLIHLTVTRLIEVKRIHR